MRGKSRVRGRKWSEGREWVEGVELGGVRGESRVKGAGVESGVERAGVD